MKDKIIMQTEEFVKKVNKNIEVLNARNNRNDESVKSEWWRIQCFTS